MAGTAETINCYLKKYYLTNSVSKSIIMKELIINQVRQKVNNCKYLVDKKANVKLSY